MPGFYDNERREYVARDDWENGQWLVSTAGALYIIPIDGDQVEGPDDENADRILQALDGRDRLQEHEASDLELTIVPDVLKRFDNQIGYYNA